MPKYRCTTKCYGLRNRMWVVGEEVKEDFENMPKDENGKLLYFEEVGEKQEEHAEVIVKKPDVPDPPIEFDKPLNSMTKKELLGTAKQLGLDIDPTIHHATMRSMIAKRLHGKPS